MINQKKENKEDCVIHGKRAIAMFDILGFKERIRKSDLSDLPDIIDQVIALSKASFPMEGIVGSIVYSDSILLFGLHGHHEFEAQFLAVTASNLFNVFSRHRKIPIRGALTYGDVFIDPKRNVALGSALVRAYELEQEQDWVGAIVDPDEAELFAQGVALKPEFLTKYHAPMKIGIRRDYYCSGWVLKGPVTEDDLSKMMFSGRDSISHAVYRKYRNTTDFLHYCRGKYSDYFNNKASVSFSNYSSK